MGSYSLSNPMTPDKIRALCKKNDLYMTPDLNEVLYLHFQGFDGIAGLEDYTQLKCLWLDSNAIAEIRGLDNQRNLKCLFLQNNLIRKIENLSSCPQLDTLNLSHNQIRLVENCDSTILPALSSVDLSHNHLDAAHQLACLQDCRFVSVLDLSHNRIDDVLVVKVLAAMPSLRVLTMTGNPVISMIPNYRKTMILECKSLTYLDNRPVSERDRACADAWKRGGYAAERAEQERWIRAANRKTKEDINRLLQKRNDQGHQPPFKLLNVDSEEDGDEQDSLNSNNNDRRDLQEEQSGGEWGIRQRQSLHQDEVVDNLESWKTVEKILANPGLCENRQDYLSQFVDIPIQPKSHPDFKNDEENAMDQELHSADDSPSNQVQSRDLNGNAVPSSPAPVLESPALPLSPGESPQPPVQEAGEDTNSGPQSTSAAVEGAALAASSASAQSQSSSSIFPSFIRVTYPDPVTNQFQPVRPQIEVAHKYATLQETKKTRDCPEVEPLFVDLPLAQLYIDYEAMRQIPCEIDAVVQDCVQELEVAEAESLRHHESYLKEVDRIYKETVETKRLDARPVQGAGSVEEASASSAAAPIAIVEVKTDKHTESFFGQDSMASKVCIDDGDDGRKNSYEEDGRENLPNRGNPFEFNNNEMEKPLSEIVDSIPRAEISNQASSSSDPVNSLCTSNAAAVSLNLPPLRPPHTNRPSPSGAAASPLVAGQSNDPVNAFPLNIPIWGDDCDASWVRDYLNDTTRNVDELTEVTGAVRQLSKERLAKIRAENERIVESIKRLYADKTEINQMRRNLGAVKEDLMDSQTMPESPFSFELADNNQRPSLLFASASPSNSSINAGSGTGDDYGLVEHNVASYSDNIGQIEESLTLAKTEVDNAAEAGAESDKETGKKNDGEGDGNCDMKTAAADAKIKARAEKLLQHDTMLQLKDIKSCGNECGERE